MSVVRHAVLGLLRNRRRTLSSVLGVLLAVTFVAGTLIAIDSSTRATLDGVLGRSPVDLFIYAQTADTTGMREAVAAVPGVSWLRV